MPGARFAVLALGLAGCAGHIAEPSGDEPPDETLPRASRGPLTCDRDEAPAPTPLTRLSVQQYRNTLAGLFDAVPGAIEAADAGFAQLPVDGIDEESFTHMDRRLSQRHIDAYYDVADAIASFVAGDPERRAAIAGDCGRDASLTEACVRGLLGSFGTRVYRRPLEPAEIDRLLAQRTDGAPAAEAMHAVLFLLLMSPELHYHLELQGSPVDGDEERLRLSAYELAARLSFHFWQTAPDRELLEAAANGELGTDDGYRAQVERLWSDARTRETLHRFYSEWLHMSAFTGFVSNARFEAFRRGVDTSGLHAEMVREVHDLVDYYTYDTNGSWADVLTSELSFARTPRLAELYGVEPWDGTGAPPSLPPGARSGLLTRAALLVSGDAVTNPFKRGSFVRRQILCDPLSQPVGLPPGALVPPEPAAERSTREAFAAKVAEEPCASCHGQFSDLGYVLERFDGLARWRSEETLLDPAGETLSVVPVDSGAVPRVELDDTRPVADPVELSERIAESDKSAACFARHYFRFTYRRPETARDGCQVGAIREALTEGAGLRDALRDIALAPEFRLRIWEEP